MRLRPLATMSVSLSLGQQVPLNNGEPVRGELGRSATSLDEKRPPTEAAIVASHEETFAPAAIANAAVKIDVARVLLNRGLRDRCGLWRNGWLLLT